MAKCRKCGEDIIIGRDRNGSPVRLEQGLVPYWVDIKGRERVLDPAGNVIRCRLDGDAEALTDVAHPLHVCRKGIR